MATRKNRTNKSGKRKLLKMIKAVIEALAEISVIIATIRDFIM